MEIDITRFVERCEPSLFSASVAEAGPNAGKQTWLNAKLEGTESPLLTTEEQLEALREYVRGYGAWEAEEIAAWSPAECNALLIQMISGDIREAGMDEVAPEDFDWSEYERRSAAGNISGRLYRGDDGRVYFYLGE